MVYGLNGMAAPGVVACVMQREHVGGTLPVNMEGQVALVWLSACCKESVYMWFSTPVSIRKPLSVEEGFIIPGCRTRTAEYVISIA